MSESRADSKHLVALRGLSGECTCRGELPPRRRPWFFDNGAFRDWKAGEPFDSEAFQLDVERMRRERLEPDFVVAPDVVGGGLASLDYSLSWIDRLAGFRVYLAVQDGMRPGDVAPHLDRFSGIFVGGTLEWKLETAREWADFAHVHGLPCHVGRVGRVRSNRRVGPRATVGWAREIGADSIDSSEPLWSNEKLRDWLGALASRQSSLW